jgi:hypothetical protein
MATFTASLLLVNPSEVSKRPFQINAKSAHLQMVHLGTEKIL